MRAQVRALQSNFANIATQTSEHIQEKNINTQTFRLRFKMQMNLSQRDEYQQFLQCCLKRLEPGTTTDDLLYNLSDYWDFFNYGLLEHTVNVFGDASLKQDMEDYIDELRAFRENTKLCDFIDNWPVQGQDPPKADFKHFVVKMEKSWEECTLEDIEKFKGTLTHKFFLPDFVLILREAKKGCICLTWYTPAVIAKALLENLPHIETKFVKTHCIQRTSINGQELHFPSHDPQFTGSAGRERYTRFKGFFGKLAMLSVSLLSLVVVLIDIVANASEEHKSILSRDSSIDISDKTNRNEMICHPTYWMSLFISFTFTSSFLSLEYLVFRNRKAIANWDQLLYSILLFFAIAYSFVTIVWKYSFPISSFITALTPWVLLLEATVYMIMFYILRHFCNKRWWWKHCMSVLYIVGCMCNIGLILTAHWQAFIVIVVIVISLLSWELLTLAFWYKFAMDFKCWQSFNFWIF